MKDLCSFSVILCFVFPGTGTVTSAKSAVWTKEMLVESGENSNWGSVKILFDVESIKTFFQRALLFSLHEIVIPVSYKLLKRFNFSFNSDTLSACKYHYSSNICWLGFQIILKTTLLIVCYNWLKQIKLLMNTSRAHGVCWSHFLSNCCSKKCVFQLQKYADGDQISVNCILLHLNV